MAISKKAGKKGASASVAPPPGKAGAPPTKKGGVAKADWREGFKKPQAGVSDMTLLSKVSNDAINDNLRKRFQNAEIYTYIGNVLISVNPFRDLGIYTEEILASYRGKNRLEMAPHVYAIAESAYYQMKSYSENQCVIISGESGAGKTEAAKRIMQYVAAVSSSEGQEIQNIKEMVLATNPLLESFGNAKTLRNNNSSRHGKFLEILFNASGSPIGANITIYLLEKARVVGQIRDERNFHILYQLTKGATPEQREYFGLQGPEAYAYTANSRCLDVKGIDDVADFRETMQAMSIIGLSGEEQNDIIRMLAAVLWIGNCTFVENKEGNADVSDPGVPDFIAYLLEVDSAKVTKALTQRIVETQRGGRRGSVYESPLNCTQAGAVRDALAKAIYNNLFDWIVKRINESMAARQASAANMIGILDIYGFEIFDNNSFEQLCINFVNENLQQAFIQLTLAKEQEEYASEGITWTPIKYFDNKIVVELIQERRPPGVFAALNDACATAHADPTAADNAFSQRLSALSSNPHFDSRGAKFLIRHYAGDVMYNVTGMTEKNKDALLKDILNLVDSSANSFLHALFPDRPDPDSKRRPPTAGDRIKTSSTALMETLKKSSPSYIRTIKPNANKSPSEYDDPAVLHQVKYLGLQENVRVRRAGFAYRNTFEKIVERFYLLSPHTSYAAEYTWTGDARSGCERIFIDTGIAREEWQLGRTKGFIKSPETLFALETMRDRYWHSMAQRIQRAFRNYLRYKDECARRIQRMWLNQKEGLAYAQLRDYGHSVLAGRKERRRFSLLSMRRFMGDYLDVGGTSAEGSMLREASGMGPGETVAFSARVTILVSRLGRSSKPSPRFLVLTDKAVYLLVTQLVNKVAQTTCERKILLGALSSVGLSALRDDWVLLRVTNQQEPDLFLSCFFKTELVTHLLQRTNGGLSVNVANSLEYGKGKGKTGSYTFKKDETVKRAEGRDDAYKSGTVAVPSGEAPGSVSRPPARKKPGTVRPITQGKLLKRGGPSNANNKPRPRAAPAAARSTAPVARPVAAAAVSTPPAAAAATTAKRASVARPPPPPPPPAAAAAATAEPEVPMYRALYAFETSQEGEMALAKDELVEVTQKEDNGWWLVKKQQQHGGGGAEGWAPSNYLELVPPRPKPRPGSVVGPPPAKRPPPAAPKPAAGAAAAAATTSAVPKPPPKPASAANAAPTVRDRPTSIVASADAKPVAVMPGMGEPGGFAAVLARKKAENAAARGEATTAPAGGVAPSANGATAKPPAPPRPGAKPGVPPAPATNGRAMPPPPPRRP